MAGHVITRYLNNLNKYEIINASRSKLNNNTIIIDVMDRKLVKGLINGEKPEIVINCTGVLIKDSIMHYDRAIYINSYFPHYLEELGKQLNFKLIHLSTDCVFSGKKGSYSETDLQDGIDNYARSKILGEVKNDKDLTFRTSFIGPDLKENGAGLFNWLLTQTGKVSGYAHVYWSGITTLELAKAIDSAIDQDLNYLYHLVPKEKISKHDLLCLIKEIWGRSITIIKEEKHAGDKSLINTRKDFKHDVPDYQIMLRELFEWMRNWDYGHYNK